MKPATVLYAFTLVCATVLALAQLWFHVLPFDFFFRVMVSLGLIFGCALGVSTLQRDDKANDRLNGHDELP